MPTLHFYPLSGHRAQLAIDQSNRWFIIEKQGLGWVGLVVTFDPVQIVYKVDWTDRRVHVQEVRAHLQDWATQNPA